MSASLDHKMLPLVLFSFLLTSAAALLASKDSETPWCLSMVGPLTIAGADAGERAGRAVYTVVFLASPRVDCYRFRTGSSL